MPEEFNPFMQLPAAKPDRSGYGPQYTNPFPAMGSPEYLAALQQAYAAAGLSPEQASQAYLASLLGNANPNIQAGSPMFAGQWSPEQIAQNNAFEAENTRRVEAEAAERERAGRNQFLAMLGLGAAGGALGSLGGGGGAAAAGGGGGGTLAGLGGGGLSTSALGAAAAPITSVAGSLAPGALLGTAGGVAAGLGAFGGAAAPITSVAGSLTPGALLGTGGTALGAGGGLGSQLGSALGGGNVPPPPPAANTPGLLGRIGETIGGLPNWAQVLGGVGAGALLGNAVDTPNVPVVNPMDLINASAQANRINQNTPFGNLTFSGPGNNTATMNLSPELQGIFNQRTALDQGILGQAQSRLGQLPTSPLQPQSLQRNLGTPTLQGSVPGESYQRSVGVPNLQTQLGLQTSVPGQNLQRSVSQQSNVAVPQLQNSVAQQNLQRSVDLQRSIGVPTLERSPNLQTDIGGVTLNGQLDQPALQRQIAGLDESRVSGMPAQFDPYRAEVERAFYDRSAGLLNEQFGKDEERLRQTLANQGFQAGSQGFGAELGGFNQRRGETFENLSRDAVLYGGQEASRQLASTLALRGQGFNEALSRFGAGATQGQFANDALQQMFANQAQAQGFSNQTQLAQQGANAARAGFSNDSLMRMADFNNQSSLGQFGMNLGAANFGNNAALASGNFYNDAAMRALEQDLARGNFSNNAAQNTFGMNMSNAQLYNQANLNQGNFANNASMQAFDQSLQQGNFANNALINQGNFYNNAQQGQFGMNLGAANFANDASSRAFEQSLAQGNFSNSAAQNQFGMNLNAANFGNNAALSAFGMDQASRAQNMAELGGLLGLQQTQLPNLGSFFPPGAVNTNDAFALQQAGLQNQYNQQAAKKGSVANLGGLLGAAVIGG